MHCSAFRTDPFFHGQISCIRIPMPAAGTDLAGREECIDYRDYPPVPFCLVYQFTAEFAESGVSYGSRQMVIAHHTLGFQIFETDHVISADEVRSRLLDVITAPVGNVLFQLCFAKACLFVVPAALFLTRESAAQLSQPSAAFLQMMIVGITFRIGCGRQCPEAKIYPDSGAGRRQIIERLTIKSQAPKKEEL